MKSLDGARKWQSKITGAKVAGTGMFAYVARCALGSGPNIALNGPRIDQCDAVLRMLQSTTRPLGARLHVQLDNTCGENKNLTGHTYLHLDQSFSTLIKNLKEYAVYTVPGLLYRIRMLLAVYHVVELRKDAAGVVRIFFRKSSQAATWLPKGHGYPVFKSDPVGSPLFFAFKPDCNWERPAVESTVRAWLPHFALPRVEDRDAAQQEWAQRLWQLKPNMQAADLSENDQLEWIQDLTLNMNRPPADGAYATGDNLGVVNIAERVENPDVDPITGPGRTAAMVRADILRHQEEARTQSAAQPMSSIFSRGSDVMSPSRS
eukprot:6145824-Pleurochrysis_carterae.AAC.2